MRGALVLLSIVDAPVMHRLRRILRRFLEMLVSDLQVMLGRDRLAVAEPCTDDVARELVFEFSNFITRDYPAEEYDAIYSIGA